MITLILFVLGLFLYFLPAIIGRQKRNFIAILMLNIFLGWTLVGWVVALVWAVAEEQPLATQSASSVLDDKSVLNYSTDKFDKLEKLKGLLDKQILTVAEYQKEKEKILAQ